MSHSQSSGGASIGVLALAALVTLALFVGCDTAPPVLHCPAVGDADRAAPSWTRLAPPADLLFSCPPYGDLEQYSDDPADLSTCDSYKHFLERLRVCLRRCYAAVVSGGRLAVLVGDVRRKGTYIPIVRDVLNMEGELGQVRSVVIKLQHNCRSDRVTYDRMEDVPIQHEYCVVFKKPETT